jgi:hypothetical protein
VQNRGLALSDCRSFKEIQFSRSLSRLGSKCFSGCALTTVTFATASPLKFIGKAAFLQCRSVTAISLPAILEQLSELPFSECFPLSAVIIESPSRLSQIGPSCFQCYFALRSFCLHRRRTLMITASIIAPVFASFDLNPALILQTLVSMPISSVHRFNQSVSHRL